MSTYVAKAGEIEKKWYVIDAEGKTLGRLATEVAMLLMGKKKAEYTPFLDTGDFVIVVNAEKVVVTGKKLTDKLYRHHTGYAGGLKEVALQFRSCPQGHNVFLSINSRIISYLYGPFLSEPIVHFFVSFIQDFSSSI